MEDVFSLPVQYKGQTLSFEAQLLVFTYSYKIKVIVNGVEILFEPDENRNYRAVLGDPNSINVAPDKELVKQVAVAIMEIVNGS